MENEQSATGNDFGFLGARIGVGYAIAWFQLEVSVGYRNQPRRPLTFYGTEVVANVTLLELRGGVDYDIDRGLEVIPYIGVSGGISQVIVEDDTDYYYVEDSLWALSLQAAAGISYAAMEELTLPLGYRLTSHDERSVRNDQG